VCYVKLSQKRPDFEKTKPAPRRRDSNIMFAPVWNFQTSQNSRSFGLSGHPRALDLLNLLNLSGSPRHL
jgi:hypothetical protein